MANLPFDNGLAAGASIYLRRMIIAVTIIVAVNTIGYAFLNYTPVPVLIWIMNAALAVVAVQQRELSKARRKIRRRENELLEAIAALNMLSESNPPPRILDIDGIKREIYLTDETRLEVEKQQRD